MHGLVRSKLEHRCWCARGEDVSFTDVEIKIPDRKCDLRMWMTPCTGSVRGGFWGIWEKVSELRTRLRTGSVDFRGSQRPDEYARYGRRRRWCVGGGVDGKVIIERLCISLPYVETFKLKGNKKVSYLNLEVVSVFRVSGFLCSMYIWYEHSMYVSHISVS